MAGLAAEPLTGRRREHQEIAGLLSQSQQGIAKLGFANRVDDQMDSHGVGHQVQL